MLMCLITRCDVSKMVAVLVSTFVLSGCVSNASVEHLLEPAQTVEREPVSCSSSEILYCDHRKAGARHHCVCASRSFW